MTANGKRPVHGGGTDVVVTLVDVGSADQWQAAAGSLGGDWANPAHWLGGQVPGSADAVAIGPSLNATADFIVTATNETAGSLTMITPQTPSGIGAGTLAVTGTLAVEGELAFDHAELLVDGATVETGEATLDGPNSSFDPGLGGALLEDGGTWHAASVQVGETGSAQLNLQAGTSGTGGTLDVAGAISIGLDVDSLTTGIFAAGELSVTGASTVEAAALNLFSFADVTLDGTGAVVLGAASATAGAVVIGANATLTVIDGNLWGNLIDDGQVAIGALESGANFGTLTVHGSLSGTGSLALGGWLDVADAAAFTGTISLAPQARLIVDDSSFGDMRVVLNNGTIALGSVAYTIGLGTTYDAVAGTVSLAGVTLDVGTGFNPGDFFAQADPYGDGTDIVEQPRDIWQANSAGAGGNWADATHWSAGRAPLAGDTVAIGPGLSAGAPFGITAESGSASDLQLSDSEATLTATGSLTFSGTVTLDAGTLVSAVGGIVTAPTLDQIGGALIADAGALVSTDASIEDAVSLLDGGSWTTEALAIDANVSLDFGPGGFIAGQTLISTGDVSLANGPGGVGGTLAVSGLLSLGSYDAASLLDDGLSEFSNFAGELTIAGSSTVTAASVLMTAGSTIALDAAASMSVGTIAGFAGAVVISGTLIASDPFGGAGPNTILADVNDDGLLQLAGGGLAISGLLSGTGSLSVNGTMSVGDLELSTATVALGAGSDLIVASGRAINLYGSTLLDDGGTLSGGSGAVLTYNVSTIPGSTPGVVTLQDGGTWITPSLTIDGVTGTMVALRNGPTLADGGTLDVSGTLAIGPADFDDPSTGTLTVDGASMVDASDIEIGGQQLDAVGTGVVTVSDGAEVAAGSLSLAGGSLLDMQDKTGMVRIGDAPGVGGAVAIGAGATLSGGNGEIFGDVVDAGLLQVGSTFDLGQSLSVVGSLTGDGFVTVADGTLEVADASEFAGTIAVGDGSVFAFDGDNLENAVLQLGTGATLGLWGLAYSPELVPAYDPATGQLNVGGVVVAVGTGYTVGQFGLSLGGVDVTDVTLVTQDVWMATGAGTGGDWSDTTHWSSGAAPGAGNSVAIGLGIASTTPWTVTVDTASASGNLALTSAAATLDVASALNVVGVLTLDQGFLLDTGTLAAQTIEALGGTLLAQAGTIVSGDATVGTASTLSNGASWSTGAMTIGLDSSLAVQDSSLAVSGTLIDRATLDVLGGGQVAAGAVAAFDTIEVDPSGVVAIGGAAAVAGAVALGSGATLTGGLGNVVDGNLVDDGTISVSFVSESFGLGLPLPTTMTIAGSLTGTGDVAIAGLAPGSTSATQLSVVSAQNFAGSITLGSGLLSLLTGDLRDASLTIGPGGLLDLDAQSPTAPVAYDATTGVLTIGGSTLNVGTGLTRSDFDIRADTGTGTFVSEVIPCFVAGTRIATDMGEVPVEVLAPGDLVRTYSGALRPVRWVGRRRVDCRRHTRPQTVTPVRIAAHAFANGKPRRALLLSPDHAVYFGGVLIPVRCLINGATIAPVDVASVEYFHVELDSHDVLLADGLPAESFLDTGNRGAFAGGTALQLHPEFARAVWDGAGCAKLVAAGPALQKARRRLLDRAVSLRRQATA